MSVVAAGPVEQLVCFCVARRATRRSPDVPEGNWSAVDSPIAVCCRQSPDVFANRLLMSPNAMSRPYFSYLNRSLAQSPTVHRKPSVKMGSSALFKELPFH